MELKTLNDLNDIAGKVVLVRADLNVPLQDGKITDTTRIDRFLPTLTALMEKGAKVAILSHLGRPKGERKPEFSLKPVYEYLADKIDIAWADDCIGDVAKDAIDAMENGQAVLLENVRFYADEKNDPEFSKQLADLGDIYVNDGFSVSHRAHASTEGITCFLPSYAGLSLQQEVEALASTLETPEKPVVAIVGGAKISTKITVLSNLLLKVNVLIIGGAMANTFLYAQGYEMGKSLCEPDMKETALNILEKAEEYNVKIVLPTDLVVAKEFAANAANEVVPVDAVPADSMALDFGPDTAAFISQVLEVSKTVIWNGPFGAFEIEPFDACTNAVAQKVAALTVDGKIVSVAGGGDTVSALNNAGVSEDFTYISTAGGAFLEWMEGKELPAILPLVKAI